MGERLSNALAKLQFDRPIWSGFTDYVGWILFDVTSRTIPFRNFEYLEYLGDSLLEFIVRSQILDYYPDITKLVGPGTVRKLTEELVKNVTLFCHLKNLGLCHTGVVKRCADRLEALLGAMFIYLRAINYPNPVNGIRLWMETIWPIREMIQDWVNHRQPVYKTRCSKYDGVTCTSKCPARFESRRLSEAPSFTTEPLTWELSPEPLAQVSSPEPFTWEDSPVLDTVTREI